MNMFVFQRLERNNTQTDRNTPACMGWQWWDSAVTLQRYTTPGDRTDGLEVEFATGAPTTNLREGDRDRICLCVCLVS